MKGCPEWEVSVGIVQRQEYSTGNLDDNLLTICEVLDEYTGVESGKW